jgi:putative addiction module CopG family antidote
MVTEQMSVFVPPKMARFIRAKVKAGEYANKSEAIRDAVRRMQESEPPLNDGIQLAVEQGVRDLAEGRSKEYDADGLRGLARRLVRNSVKKGRSLVRNG